MNTWFSRRMSEECRYLVILLKSGLCINAKFSSETLAKDALGRLVKEYSASPHAGILIGDQPAPMVFLASPEIAATYVSKEARR